MTDEVRFPSITFPATFEGTAAIGADFSATLKLKTANGPKVLEDLKAMPRGTYDVTILARQAELKGDSTDREWSNMKLDGAEPGELLYEELCLGSRCPVFVVHTSGDLEGKYVCEDGAEVEAYIEVVNGKTLCPRYPQGVEAESAPEPPEQGEESLEPPEAQEAPAAAQDEALPEFSPEEKTASAQTEPPVESPAVLVMYPGSSDGWVTAVGERTLYGEFVADYFAWKEVNGDPEKRARKTFIVTDDEGNERKLRSKISPEDHGKTLYVECIEVES